MGIPVWVSRDIVVALDDPQLTTGSNVEQAQAYSQSQQHQPTTQTISASNSAVSILQSLSQQSEPSNRQRQLTQNPAAKNPASPVQSESKTLADSSKNYKPTQNEIARTASHLVYACGSMQADWMIIGESPELNDERSHQPYSGDAGILLENMLRAVGLENPRKDAYIVNVIKASMQAIVPESVGELNQILSQKIKQVNPKLILIVGQLSAQNVLQSKEPLARLRAKAQKHPETNTDIIVTYYPTHLLSKPIDKRKAWEDLKLAMKLINDAPDAASL